MTFGTYMHFEDSIFFNRKVIKRLDPPLRFPALIRYSESEFTE